MPKSAFPALINRRPVYLAPDGSIQDPRVTPESSRLLVTPFKHLIASAGYSSAAGGWSEEIIVERWTLPPMEYPEITLSRHRLTVFLDSRPLSAPCVVDGRAYESVVAAGHIRLLPQGVSAGAHWLSQRNQALIDFSSGLIVRLLDGRASAPSEQVILRVSVADHVAYDLTCSILAELAMPTERLYGELLCLALAVHMLRSYGRTSIDAVRFKGRLSAIQARRVLECMRASLENGVSVAELAREAGLSDAHFSRAFRATFGEPPHRLMLRWRLERALRLIAKHGMRPTEAALATGFCDQAHLTNAMRKHFGNTPAGWMKR